jgi:hypothetical protein
MIVQTSTGALAPYETRRVLSVDLCSELQRAGAPSTADFLHIRTNGASNTWRLRAEPPRFWPFFSQVPAYTLRNLLDMFGYYNLAVQIERVERWEGGPRETWRARWSIPSPNGETWETGSWGRNPEVALAYTLLDLHEKKTIRLNQLTDSNPWHINR